MPKSLTYPTRAFLIENFTYANGRLYRLNGKIAGYLHHNKNGSKRYEVKIQGKNYLNSILVWTYHNDTVPNDLIVDHINSCEFDDRIENLQIITIGENNIKRTKNKKPNGYRGVYKDMRTGRYYSKIAKDYKTTHLGFFATAEEAAIAYDNFAEILFANFSDFNLPRN